LLCFELRYGIRFKGSRDIGFREPSRTLNTVYADRAQKDKAPDTHIRRLLSQSNRTRCIDGTENIKGTFSAVIEYVSSCGRVNDDRPVAKKRPPVRVTIQQ